MKNNKQSKLNLRFAKKLKKELSRRKMIFSDFNIYDGYFMLKSGGKSVINFTAGEYRFGVWLHSGDVFAEHLGYMDKFKPTASSFWEKLIDGYDDEKVNYILSFVNSVSTYSGDRLVEWRESLREDREALRKLPLVDLECLHEVKGISDKFHEVRWINPDWDRYRDVQDTELEIILSEDVSDKELWDLEELVKGVCMEKIYGLDYDYWQSKMYQSVLNGTIKWFIRG